MPPTFQAVQWIGDTNGYLRLIDQTKLPTELAYVDCRDVATVWDAIKSLAVRGAPAIGIAAAYGVVVGMQTLKLSASPSEMEGRFRELVAFLASSRPTAVNLFWALDRMKARFESHSHAKVDEVQRRLLEESDVAQSSSIAKHVAQSSSFAKCGLIDEVQRILLEEADQIFRDDRDMCHAIGRHGAPLLKATQSILTHCNTGGLATAEYGTALSMIFTCQDQGHHLHVFVDETRPLLQGARLTAWELMSRKVDCTLICDSMAAQVMREGRVQAVVVGADRIAANGDTANKIGTYSVAVLAKAHQIPFYVAAPSSTFDLTIESGSEIPIESRKPEEITCAFGKQTAPVGVPVYNPAFDVTPADLITAIVTERGVISPVNREAIRQCVT